MKTTRSFRFVIACLALVLAVAGCTKGEGGAQEPEPETESLTELLDQSAPTHPYAIVTSGPEENRTFSLLRLPDAGSTASSPAQVATATTTTAEGGNAETENPSRFPLQGIPAGFNPWSSQMKGATLAYRCGEAKNGQELCIMDFDHGRARRIAGNQHGAIKMSEDGMIVATVVDDGIIAWDVESDQLLGEMSFALTEGGGNLAIQRTSLSQGNVPMVSYVLADSHGGVVFQGFASPAGRTSGGELCRIVDNAAPSLQAFVRKNADGVFDLFLLDPLTNEITLLSRLNDFDSYSCIQTTDAGTILLVGEVTSTFDSYVDVYATYTFLSLFDRSSGTIKDTTPFCNKLTTDYDKRAVFLADYDLSADGSRIALSVHSPIIEWDDCQRASCLPRNFKMALAREGAWIFDRNGTMIHEYLDEDLQARFACDDSRILMQSGEDRHFFLVSPSGERERVDGAVNQFFGPQCLVQVARNDQFFLLQMKSGETIDMGENAFTSRIVMLSDAVATRVAEMPIIAPDAGTTVAASSLQLVGVPPERDPATGEEVAGGAVASGAGDASSTGGGGVAGDVPAENHAPEIAFLTVSGAPAFPTMECNYINLGGAGPQCKLPTLPSRYGRGRR